MFGKNYIFILVLACISMTAMSAALNYAVDPLSYFHANTRFVRYSSERELKSVLIDRGPYDGIIMGSSKVTYIQPEDINYDGKILNAGFSGALPEEILYFLQEKNPKMKWLAIGLDWFMFNEHEFPFIENTGKHFSKTFIEKARYLLSIDTGYYSITSLRYYFKGIPFEYTKSGARNAVRIELEDKAYNKYSYEETLETLRETHFSNYNFSEKRVAMIAQIQKWAEERNIILVVWLGPLQTRVDSLVRSSVGDKYDYLPRELSKGYGTFVDLTEAYPEKENYFKEDPFHYYPSTGKKFFNARILPNLN